MATFRNVLVLLLALTIFSQAASAAAFALTPAPAKTVTASQASGHPPCHAVMTPARGAKKLPPCCDKACPMMACAAAHVAMLPAHPLLLQGSASSAVASACERLSSRSSPAAYRPPISLLG